MTRIALAHYEDFSSPGEPSLIGVCAANDTFDRVEETTRNGVARGDALNPDHPDSRVIEAALRSCAEEPNVQTAVSRTEYEDGLNRLFSRSFADTASASQLGKISACLAERSYGRVTEATREQIADGRDVPPGTEDAQLLTLLADECAGANLASEAD